MRDVCTGAIAPPQSLSRLIPASDWGEPRTITPIQKAIALTPEESFISNNPLLRYLWAIAGTLSTDTAFAQSNISPKIFRE